MHFSTVEVCQTASFLRIPQQSIQGSMAEVAPGPRDFWRRCNSRCSDSRKRCTSSSRRCNWQLGILRQKTSERNEQDLRDFQENFDCNSVWKHCSCWYVNRFFLTCVYKITWSADQRPWWQFRSKLLANTARIARLSKYHISTSSFTPAPYDQVELLLQRYCAFEFQTCQRMKSRSQLVSCEYFVSIGFSWIKQVPKSLPEEPFWKPWNILKSKISTKSVSFTWNKSPPTSEQWGKLREIETWDVQMYQHL